MSRRRMGVRLRLLVSRCLEQSSKHEPTVGQVYLLALLFTQSVQELGRCCGFDQTFHLGPQLGLSLFGVH